MRIDVVTLFPEMFEAPLGRSIVGKAREKGLLELGFTNPRAFTSDRHHTVDDRPYGGGPGMILKPEPMYAAIKAVKKRGSRVIYLSPQGRTFDQKLAKELSAEKHLVLLAGHYEGIDERLLKHVDMELSIGDYVLTGGELAAMVVVDAVARLLPGVLSEEAVAGESFASGLLDYPQYTRPQVWQRAKVPEVLLTGNHAAIYEWRRKAASAATRRKRIDLLKSTVISRKRGQLAGSTDRNLVRSVQPERRTTCRQGE